MPGASRGLLLDGWQPDGVRLLRVHQGGAGADGGGEGGYGGGPAKIEVPGLGLRGDCGRSAQAGAGETERGSGMATRTEGSKGLPVSVGFHTCAVENCRGLAWPGELYCRRCGQEIEALSALPQTSWSARVDSLLWGTFAAVLFSALALGFGPYLLACARLWFGGK